MNGSRIPGPGRSARRALAPVRALVAGLVAVLALIAVAAAVRPTSAAWTEPAYFTAPASSGSWSGSDRCDVHNADGTIDPTKTCTMSTPTSSFFQKKGVWQGNYSITLTAPSLTNDQYLTFTLTIPGTPAGWVWGSTSAITTQNFGTITSACAALPTFSGQTRTRLGNTINVSLSFLESATASDPVLCSR